MPMDIFLATHPDRPIDIHTDGWCILMQDCQCRLGRGAALVPANLTIPRRSNPLLMDERGNSNPSGCCHRSIESNMWRGCRHDKAAIDHHSAWSVNHQSWNGHTLSLPTSSQSRSFWTTRHKYLTNRNGRDLILDR